MKYLLILIMLGTVGCAGFKRSVQPDKRAVVKSCIMEFINEDVLVKSAQEICNDIYRRVKR